MQTSDSLDFLQNASLARSLQVLCFHLSSYFVIALDVNMENIAADTLPIK